MQISEKFGHEKKTIDYYVGRGGKHFLQPTENFLVIFRS